MNPWSLTIDYQKPSPFTPPLLPGLAQWLAAYKGTYQDTGLTSPAVVNGAPVKGWADLSGSGNNEKTPDGQTGASLLVGAQNLLPAVSFDGVSSMLKALFTLTQPVTIFAVLRLRALAGNQVLFDGGTYTQMACFQQTTPVLSLYALGGLSPSSPPITPDAFLTLEAVFNGPASKIAVNGGSPVVGSPGTADPNGVTLGGNASRGTFAAVDFGDWALWPRLLNPSEETAMWNYLRGLWATW